MLNRQEKLNIRKAMMEAMLSSNILEMNLVEYLNSEELSSEVWDYVRDREKAIANLLGV